MAITMIRDGSPSVALPALARNVHALARGASEAAARDHAVNAADPDQQGR